MHDSNEEDEDVQLMEAFSSDVRLHALQRGIEKGRGGRGRERGEMQG